MVKQTQTKVTMIKLGVAKLKGTTFIFILWTITTCHSQHMLYN